MMMYADITEYVHISSLVDSTYLLTNRCLLINLIRVLREHIAALIQKFLENYSKLI